MALRFRFRLETVERIRRQARDQKRRVVAGALQEVDRAQRTIGELNEQLAATECQKRKAQQSQRLDMALLRGHQFYRGDLQRRLFESHEMLLQRAASLEQARTALADASKRWKAVERLRARQWARHVTELRRHEQRAMDEAALQMHQGKAEGRFKVFGP